MSTNMFSIGLVAVLGLVNAQSVIPSSSLCPTANGRTIYDTNGAGYLVTCSADNDRGSYTNTQASNSYLDCMNACDSDSKCLGFTYVGGNGGKGAGTCWLKSEMTTYPSRAPNIISAVRVSNATDQAGASASTAILKGSTSSSQRPSATSASPSPSSIASRNLCPSYNFTTYADNEDNNWQILCGFDTSPSSFDVIDVSSFALCLEACNAEDACIAVSYFGTACYFKNGYEGLTSSKDVNSAFIINKANYPVPSRNEVYAGRGCGLPLEGIQAGGSTAQFFINSGGLSRSFSVHVPSSYDTNRAAPLIFAFHGRSETPVNIEGYSGLSSEALNPYGIVVYPLGVAANDSGYPQWQSDPDTVDRTPYVDDQTFVQDLIVHMTSNYCIDTSRILATGFSNGGGLVGILACNSSLSNQFSAFAINAGAQYTNDSDTAGCPQSGDVPSTILTNTLVQPVCAPGRRNVPILEFHGDTDGTIPYSGGPRRGYCLPTILHWVSDWAVRNLLSNASVVTPLANGQVTKYEFGSDENQGIVTHYKIAGWNHAWVSRAAAAPIDSTPIILAFLYRFTNPNALRYIPAPPNLSTASSVVSSSTLAHTTSSSAVSSSTLVHANSSSAVSSSIQTPASFSPSAIIPPASSNLSSTVLPITTAVSSSPSNISLPFNTTSGLNMPFSTGLSPSPVNISLPLNMTSISVPLTTAASSLPLNASMPSNTSSIVAGSTTNMFNTSTTMLSGTAIFSSTFSTLSTLAPFANVTTSANTTSPTPSVSSVSCPASNGTLYTDPSTGSTYQVECTGDDTATVELVNPDTITVEGATLQQCIGFCAMMGPTCQGVNMRGDTCYLETTRTGRSGSNEGARLVKTVGR